jgi:hypothetical protein
LDVAGIGGFLENRHAVYESQDSDGAAWREFLEVWAGRYDTGVTSSVLWGLASKEDLLPQILGDKGERSQRIRLGSALDGAVGKPYGRWMIVKGGRDGKTKRTVYRLSPALGLVEGGEVAASGGEAEGGSGGMLEGTCRQHAAEKGQSNHSPAACAACAASVSGGAVNGEDSDGTGKTCRTCRTCRPPAESHGIFGGMLAACGDQHAAGSDRAASGADGGCGDGCSDGCGEGSGAESGDSWDGSVYPSTVGGGSDQEEEEEREGREEEGPNRSAVSAFDPRKVLDF